MSDTPQDQNAAPTLRPVPQAPRLALTRQEAAVAIGVSVDFLDEHVVPELRVVRKGRRKIIPVRELERWLSANAALALQNERP